METVTFSTQLRTATRTEHEQAESTRFVQDLLAGSLPLAAYTAMAIQHWHIYQALEQAAEAMRDDPAAGRFVVDELHRVPALEADLAHLLGPGWRDQAAPEAATTAYCERLRQVGSSWPAGFIAHHYTRYLGDLSGGQVIRRIVSRTYDLTDGKGVAFYEFPGLPPAPKFKQHYRQLLDTLPYPEPELERLAAEARLAFQLNADVFAALGSRFPAAFPPEVVDRVSRHMNHDHAEDCLLIVQALAGLALATAARMTGLDTAGIDFAATVAGQEQPVRVPFARRLTDQAEIRGEVVELYHRACAAAGVAPRH